MLTTVSQLLRFYNKYVRLNGHHVSVVSAGLVEEFKSLVNVNSSVRLRVITVF